MTSVEHIARGADGMPIGTWRVGAANGCDVSAWIPFAPMKDGRALLDGFRLIRTIAGMPESLTIEPDDLGLVLRCASRTELERLRRLRAGWIEELASRVFGEIADLTDRHRVVPDELRALAEKIPPMPEQPKPEPSRKPPPSNEAHRLAIRRSLAALDDLELQVFADGRGVRVSMSSGYRGSIEHRRWRQAMEDGILQAIDRENAATGELADDLRYRARRSAVRMEADELGMPPPAEPDVEPLEAPRPNGPEAAAHADAAVHVTPKSRNEEIAELVQLHVHDLQRVAKEAGVKQIKRWRKEELADRIVTKREEERKRSTLAAMEHLDRLALERSDVADEVAGELVARQPEPLRPILLQYYETQRAAARAAI